MDAEVYISILSLIVYISLFGAISWRDGARQNSCAWPKEMLACSQLITNFHRWYNLLQLMKFFRQMILLFVKVENWARISVIERLLEMQKHRQRHNWPRLGTESLNSINILYGNWSSQSLKILANFQFQWLNPNSGLTSTYTIISQTRFK